MLCKDYNIGYLLKFGEKWNCTRPGLRGLEEAADEVPYSLGDKMVLQRLFHNSDISDVEVKTHSGTAHFSSVENWIHTGAKGWTEDDAISDEQLEFLLHKAEEDLADFKTPHGTVAFPTSAHIVTVRK